MGSERSAPCLPSLGEPCGDCWRCAPVEPDWWPCCPHCSTLTLPDGSGDGHEKPCKDCQTPKEPIDHV